MSVSPQTPHMINPLPMEMCQGCINNGCYPWNKNPLLLCSSMGGMIPVFLLHDEDTDVVMSCLQYKLVSDEHWSLHLKDRKWVAKHNEEMRMRSLTHENPVYSSDQLPAEYVQAIAKGGGLRTEHDGLYFWQDGICHDCDAEPGELHKLGCDVERCPICEGQLISCSEEHFRIVERGKLRPRIPYIPRLRHCALCGVGEPKMFMVPDSEWDKYVPPQLQPTVICRPCYDELKEMFPDGWRDVKQ